MTNQRDYYEVLGVSKTATEQEIKSAFRKLSIKYHPDKQAGKSESEKKIAEEKFKEIAAAYDVLSDKTKREQYDQFGFNGPQGFGRQDVDMNEFLKRHASMFGHMFGRNPFGFDFGFDSSEREPQNPIHPENGRDVVLNISIDFKTSLFGCTKEIDLDLSDPCPKCNGSGLKDSSKITKCTVCGGSGVLTQHLGPFSIMQQTCSHCHGSGYQYEICPECKGQKRISTKKHIKFKIPAGIDSRQRLRIKDSGECGVCGGQNGTLYINITVEPNEIFTRNGKDLEMTVYISPIIAILGGTIEIPTPYGNCKLKIPAETKSGTILKVHGKGVKIDNTHGNLKVKIEIEPLSKITPEQRNLLEQLQKTVSASNLPLTEKLKQDANVFYNS